MRRTHQRNPIAVAEGIKRDIGLAWTAREERPPFWKPSARLDLPFQRQANRVVRQNRLKGIRSHDHPQKQDTKDTCTDCSWFLNRHEVLRLQGETVGDQTHGLVSHQPAAIDHRRDGRERKECHHVFAAAFWRRKGIVRITDQGRWPYA